MIRKAKLSDFKGVFGLLNQLWPNEKISKYKSIKIYSELLKDYLKWHIQNKEPS